MKRALAALAILLPLLMSVPASAETVKARVTGVDERRSEVRVDVAGSGRTYRVDDRSLYRLLRPGRLVVIRAEFVNGRHTIVEARAASQAGRVEEIDERSGRIDVREDGGGTATYYLDQGVPARGLRRGDAITYEVEERGRRNVITRLSRVGGGGDRAGSSDRDRDRGRMEVYRDAGVIADVDHRRTQLTIALDSNRRRTTFDVADKRLMESLRNGDRVRIEFEQRGDRMVITSIR